MGPFSGLVQSGFLCDSIVQEDASVRLSGEIAVEIHVHNAKLTLAA